MYVCSLLPNIYIHLRCVRLFTVGHTVGSQLSHIVIEMSDDILPLHFLREAVDLPMRDAPILDWLAMTLPPLAVLGRVL